MEDLYLKIVGGLVVLLFGLMVKEIKESRKEFSKDLREVKSEISEVGKSVKILNVEFAKVIQNQDWHKEEIQEMKGRIFRLENKEKNS